MSRAVLSTTVATDHMGLLSCWKVCCDMQHTLHFERKSDYIKIFNVDYRLKWYFGSTRLNRYYFTSFFSCLKMWLLGDVKVCIRLTLCFCWGALIKKICQRSGGHNAIKSQDTHFSPMALNSELRTRNQIRQKRLSLPRSPWRKTNMCVSYMSQCHKLLTWSPHNPSNVTQRSVCVLLFFLGKGFIA